MTPFLQECLNSQTACVYCAIPLAHAPPLEDGGRACSDDSSHAQPPYAHICLCMPRRTACSLALALLIGLATGDLLWGRRHDGTERTANRVPFPATGGSGPEDSRPPESKAPVTTTAQD